MQSYSPHLWNLLCALVSRSTVSSPTSEATSRVGATIASSLMLKFRDAKASWMQLLTTLVLIAKGTKKEAITTLDHLGVALSYQQTWRRLQSMSTEGEDRVSYLRILASSRKHISHSCKSCESFVERMSVGTCSSCGASLFRLLLHASNVRIVQLLQAVVFLQTVPLLYSCTLSVLVFSANLLSSWLVLVVSFLEPMRLIFVGG